MTRIAAWQYPIEAHASWDAWVAKLDAGAREAAAAGAELLVMPEYASMELTSALHVEDQGDLARELAGLQALWPAYVATGAALARERGVYLLMGSIPEHVGHEYRNRARLHGPGGEAVVIEKLQMTRFERERWGIAAGSGQTVIELGGGVRLGVAICYDSEFPLIVRRLVDHGARVILVPSCNDALSGYWRVRIACQARALENQCYVVQAPTVGSAPWSIALDENRGAAGVYGPPDRGFPETGVIAMGVLDQPGWVMADIDLAMVEAVRLDGQVLNHRDWIRSRHLQAPVTRHTIR